MIPSTHPLILALIAASLVALVGCDAPTAAGSPAVVPSAPEWCIVVHAPAGSLLAEDMREALVAPMGFELSWQTSPAPLRTIISRGDAEVARALGFVSPRGLNALCAAVRQHARELELARSTPGRHLHRARLARWLGLTTEAVRAAEDARQGDDPGARDAATALLARLRAENGDVAGARALLAELPATTAAHLARARVAFADRESARAVAHLTSGLELPDFTSDDRAEALFFLGWARHEVDDDEGATATLQRVGRQYPNTRWAERADEQLVHVRTGDNHDH